MIAIARIFEAWRDSQIFENPTAPRGRLWHLLKFFQYGLLIASALTYFIIIHELVFPFQRLAGQLLFTAGAILVDIGVAWLVFEFFLKLFRARGQDSVLWLEDD